MIDGQDARLGTPPRGKGCIRLERLLRPLSGHKPQTWEFLGKADQKPSFALSYLGRLLWLMRPRVVKEQREREWQGTDTLGPQFTHLWNESMSRGWTKGSLLCTRQTSGGAVCFPLASVPSTRLCSFLLLQPLALHLFLTVAELADEEHGGLEVMGARIIWVSHFLLQQQRREVRAWA